MNEAQRNELQRAIAESDIAGCSLTNADIDSLVDLFDGWLEVRSQVKAAPGEPLPPSSEYQRGLLEAAEILKERAKLWANRWSDNIRPEFKLEAKHRKESALALYEDVDALIRSRISEPKPATEDDHRYNYDQREDGLYVCKGDHHRSADCQWEKVLT